MWCATEQSLEILSAYPWTFLFQRVVFRRDFRRRVGYPDEQLQFTNYRRVNVTDLVNTHTHTLIHTRTHAHMHIDLHTLTHKRAHIRTHTHTHAHTPHTHALTTAHSNTQHTHAHFTHARKQAQKKNDRCACVLFWNLDSAWFFRGVCVDV